MVDKVIALVGDLINSRNIPQRIEFDDRLLKKMKELNKINSSILSPYTLIGDEIQAVFMNADNIFKDCVNILTTIYPERMRFSFGIGTLIKPINRVQATEMDGPAFYFARDGVNELKKNRHLINVVGQEADKFELLQQSLYLVSENMKKWNKVRLQTISRLLDNFQVKEIAQELAISEQAVYKTIKSGYLEIIINLLQESRDTINRRL
ncbi:MAG: SatD family protein [Anaerolineae bacterium]|nr:SatD family protein [Anaerolineae bacterium]